MTYWPNWILKETSHHLRIVQLFPSFGGRQIEALDEQSAPVSPVAHSDESDRSDGSSSDGALK